MRVDVVLEKSGDGGFTALVPSLPGCISEGDSEHDALANIREAIGAHLDSTADIEIVSQFGPETPAD